MITLRPFLSTPTSEARAHVTTSLPAERVDSIFGSDVFSRNVMRQRLPKEVYRSLHPDHRPAVSRSIRRSPMSSPRAMKDWAIENGATHYTHWFQPLTGLDRGEARLARLARRRRRRGLQLLRLGAGPGRAGRVQLPVGRHPRDLRGPRLHRVGCHQPGVPHAGRQQRHALHPDGVRVVDRRGARHQDPAAAFGRGTLARRRCAS